MPDVRRPVVVTPVPGEDNQSPLPPLLAPQPGYDPDPTPWRDVHVLPDGQTLEVTATHGFGEQLHALEADESSDDTVLLTVRVAFAQPPSSAPRPAVAYPFRARLRLQRPLAGRTATDGALGTEDDVRAEELAAATRWRAGLGLPTDPELVAALVEDARMPDGRLHGSEVMSDDEQVWYRDAMERKEAAVNFAKDWLAVQDGDLDAHGELTWLGGGEWVQYVTARADDLRADAEAAGIQRLRVELVRYPYRELDRVQAAVRDALTAVGIRVAASSVDVRTNTVVFLVDDDPAAAARIAADVAPQDAVRFSRTS